MDTPLVDREEILASVRAAHKRVTGAKRTVADVLVGAPGHLTAEAITSAVQERRADVSPSTVYRILEEFEDLGVVVHAHVGQQAAVYHLAGTVHAHLTCQSCTSILEIPSSTFDALATTLDVRFGFELDRHHAALSGTCQYCREHRDDATS